MRRFVLWSAVAALSMAAVCAAQQPGEIMGPEGRPFVPVPTPGIAVPDADRAELTAGLAVLSSQVEAIRAGISGEIPGNRRGAQAELQRRQRIADLLPDVEVYYWAVKYALD